MTRLPYISLYISVRRQISKLLLSIKKPELGFVFIEMSALIIHEPRKEYHIFTYAALSESVICRVVENNRSSLLVRTVYVFFWETLLGCPMRLMRWVSLT